MKKTALQSSEKYKVYYYIFFVFKFISAFIFQICFCMYAMCAKNTSTCLFFFKKSKSCFSAVVDGFYCLCNPGYAGMRCEQDINDCAGNMCENNSTCLDLHLVGTINHQLTVIFHAHPIMYNSTFEKKYMRVLSEAAINICCELLLFFVEGSSSHLNHSVYTMRCDALYSTTISFHLHTTKAQNHLFLFFRDIFTYSKCSRALLNLNVSRYHVIT